MSKNNETDLTHLTDRADRPTHPHPGPLPQGEGELSADLQRIELGDYVIFKPGPMGPGSVWIEDLNGGALLADERDIAGVIDRYFRGEFGFNKQQKQKPNERIDNERGN